MRLCIRMIAVTACLAFGMDASCRAAEQAESHAGASPGSSAGKPTRQDYLTPIRPGEPGKSPFWNVKSIQFMYCPSFDFKPVPSAKSYRFTAAAADGKDYTFEASKPWATLAPIWMQLPVGYVNLKVEGLDAKGGQAIGVAGERKFYRAAMYDGPYHPQLMSY